MDNGDSRFRPEITFDRPDGVYRTGEDVEFLICPIEGNAPGGWIYRLSWDGEGAIEEVQNEG